MIAARETNDDDDAPRLLPTSKTGSIGAARA
jgi:hypothetical protein